MLLDRGVAAARVRVGSRVVLLTLMLLMIRSALAPTWSVVSMGDRLLHLLLLGDRVLWALFLILGRELLADLKSPIATPIRVLMVLHGGLITSRLIK